MSRSHDVTISGFDLDRLEAELAKAVRERDGAREELKWTTQLALDMAKELKLKCGDAIHADQVRELTVALEKTLPASAGDAGVSRASRGDLHEAGVVGALRERLNRVMGLLRDVERETRQPSERFDEVWAEVREVLRG